MFPGLWPSVHTGGNHDAPRWGCFTRGAGPGACTSPGGMLERHILQPPQTCRLGQSGAGASNALQRALQEILMLAKDFAIPIPGPAPKQFALTIFVLSPVCLKCLILRASITKVLDTGEQSDTVWLYQPD